MGGTSWGMNGYVLIERGDNKCGIADGPPSYPTVNGAPVPPPAPTPPAPPSPAPTPGPINPGDCFEPEDQATCEGTSDKDTGEQCEWCYLQAIDVGICVTKEFGCNGAAVAV